MKTKMRKGFTLVEILIVVIILGILAAIVIPQFTNASEQANSSQTLTDLQTLRSQISLYRARNNADPRVDSVANFLADLQLRAMPANRMLADGGGYDQDGLGSGAGVPAAGDAGATGWYFDTTNHNIYACSGALVDPDDAASFDYTY
jgi:prepilin-type N-terminal cleavage/methylation domain-containing protein